MTKRLAIVPARGGSKRLPNKNIREFCGKPMIAHILEAARQSELFETIHVSTDDEKIGNVVTELGFLPDFIRPPELATDFIPIMPVMKYVAETYKQLGDEFDQIWLLMTCAPLIMPQDLCEAALKMDAHKGANPIMGVAPYPAPVEWAFDLADDGMLIPAEPGKFSIRSQDLGVKYYDAGSFAGFPSQHVLYSDGAGSDCDFVAHILPSERVVDIDNEDDWRLAEAIFRGKRTSLNDACNTRYWQALKKMVSLSDGKGLILRSLRVEDVTQSYADGINDPDVKQFLTHPRNNPQTVESSRAYALSCEQDDHGILFGVFWHENHIGNIRLHDIAYNLGEAFVGIAMFDKSVWGQGLGHRSLKMVVEFALSILGLKVLRAGIADANIASQRVFEKAGFKLEPGTERESPEGPSAIWVQLL